MINRDIIIIDYDCKTLSAERDKVRERLQLSGECSVFSMEEIYARDGQRQIADDGKEPARGVFLTCLSGGLKKYHKDFFTENPQISSWIITILDVEHESYRNQFRALIDQTFYHLEAYYDVVFDCQDTLADTAKACAFPMKTQKRCIVISRNQALAQRVSAVLAGYLPKWETASVEISAQEDYRFADAVLIAGEKPEELEVPAPMSGLNRRYVWLEGGFYTQEEYEELSELVGKSMNGCGWNIADYADCFYVSILIYEELYQALQKEKIGCSALRGHEKFVMWDEYGLPLTREEYTPERTEAFLKDNCRLDKIAERMIRGRT